MSGREGLQSAPCLPLLQCTHGETKAQRGKETPTHPPALVCIATWLGWSWPRPLAFSQPPLLLGVPRGGFGRLFPPLLWPHLTWSLFAPSSVALSGIILTKQGQPPRSRQLTSFRRPGQTASGQADAQMLSLIADVWPVVVAQRKHLSLHTLLHSQLVCSRCQCFIPETLVRADMEKGRKSWRTNTF